LLMVSSVAEILPDASPMRFDLLLFVPSKHFH
jgi:hypothetical protein